VALLVHGRRWPLLALYASTTMVTLVSTVHPLAHRTCLFLWPVTLMVLGGGAALAWRAAQGRLGSPWATRAVALAVLLAFCGLLTAWHLYNERVILSDLRRFAPLRWDQGCADRLLHQSAGGRSLVFYGSKYASSAFLAHGFERRSAASLEDLPFDVRGLPDVPRFWAVVDNPIASPVLEAWPGVARLDQLSRGAGLSAQPEECGAFLVVELSRP
jgi:hypothetical protein